MKIYLQLGVATLCFLTACSSPSPTLEQIALNDRGVAEMGRYEYSKAHDTFSEVVQNAPSWLEGRVNLAIATLNRQTEGDENRALDVVSDVLAEEPDHTRALYVSGMIHLYLGKPEQATPFLSRVIEMDPDDAYAAYFLGQSYLQLGDNETASRWFLKTVELEPYLRSAYWAGSQALRRIDRIDESESLLEDYQRFAPNPAARLAGFSYTRMGLKAEALSVSVENLEHIAFKPQGVLFAESQSIDIEGSVSSVTVVDINGDEEYEYLLSGEGRHIIHQGSKSRPLSVENTGVALWGDVNDDGEVDLVLCGEAGSYIYYQQDGEFGQATTLSEQACVAGALFDADHDGDLDVTVTGPAGNQLLSNNRDGTFRDIAPQMGLTGEPGHQLLVVDLDADRDLDIVVLGAQKNNVWRNDRTWQYQDYQGLEDFSGTALRAATSADVDADGHQEIYGVDQGGSVLAWRFDGRDWMRRTVTSNPEAPFGETAELAVADFDGDGQPELMRSYPGGFDIIDPRVGKVVHSQKVTGLRSAIITNVEPAKGPSILTLDSSGVTYWPPGPGRFEFLAVVPSGRSEADQMRSNASGIGTQTKVRTAGRWTVDLVMDSHSGPGQSLMPLTVGLAGKKSADYIALTWSDGVTQTELDLASGSLHVISETQRQLASCPVVFVWDGQEYRFVTDVLGVAGMGFFTAPGEVAEPRPFERYLLEPGVLRERSGKYHVKLTEPMEENAYLDAATIHVYDMPNDWSMVLDERMGEGVTGRPITFMRSVDPSRVTDVKGVEVTSLVLSEDRKAPHPGDVDARFIGLLADDQTLTMEFDEPIETVGATLVADGWVEYPYSQTVFAAWQAGLRYRSVSIETRDESGNWQLFTREFGYPAGMPRKMALPLEGLPEGTTALRLSSNLEIYWDRLRIVYEANAENIIHHVIEPTQVRVARTGFPKRSNAAQNVPHYDYMDRSPYWDTKSQRGFYTLLGDATPLVEKLDGAMAIIGGGEEIHLEFPALPEPEEKLNRHFVLDFRGWAKDMDLYTRDGETVGPLPDPDYADKTRRDLLHARYNVRFQEGM